MRTFKTALLTTLAIAPFAALQGCVTTDGSSDTPTAPEMAGEDNVPAQTHASYSPGPIEDIDLREIVYQGVEKQLSGTETDKTRVEIGDFESFKFSIVKMNRAGEDVTNVTSELPDRMTIETMGWYKRAEREGTEPKESCFSFQSTVFVTAEGTSWSYDDKEPLKFTRENSEDCF